MRAGMVVSTAMISISAAVRTATGLKGGDPIRVTPTVADIPQQVALPAGFAAALAADEQASAFFGRLSNSMQRHHADTIAAAKSSGTRQRQRQLNGAGNGLAWAHPGQRRP
jgi:Bacteriocin-protection, YdeI or OmpD-Associated